MGGGAVKEKTSTAQVVNVRPVTPPDEAKAKANGTPSGQVAPAAGGTVTRMRAEEARALGDPHKQAATTHVAVVGAGFVGTNTAFAILCQNLAGKVTLTDVNAKKCEGEVLDLEDGGGCVDVATPKQAGQADVIIITAGRGQKEGETRIDLVKANSAIMRSVIEGMKPIKPTAKIIIVSNPCDALTWQAQQCSGLPQAQVFGSGTVLDSERLRVSLSNQLDVHTTSINLFVLGEHGDSQFPATSLGNIGGMPIADVEGFADLDIDELAKKSAAKAYEIIGRKGYTAYGVAVATAKIVDCVLNDRQMVLPVAVRVPGQTAVLSLPSVVGIHGVERVLDVISHLNAKEKEQMESSCKHMEEVIGTIQA